MTNILLVDASPTYRRQLREEIQQSYPDFSIDEYDPRLINKPDEQIDWSHYHIVLMEEQQDLLDSLTVQNSINHLVLLTRSFNQDRRNELLEKGITHCINRDTINSSRFKSQLLESIENIQGLEHHNNILLRKHPIHGTTSTVPISEDTTTQLVTQPILEVDKTASIDRCPPPKNFCLMIPGYQIQREIGKGAAGTVLLAERHEDEKEVVLKVILTQENDDPEALKRFMQEYSLISHLEHPNIVKIYERGFAAEYAYIAMQYFPFGDLNRRIRQGLDDQNVIHYMKQISSALACIHDLGVVHRDLKPGNILFKENDSVCITDFGAAKLNHEQLDDITAHNMVIGTPHYMSPEQCAGMRMDHRSDLYSLGVLLFFMLTRRRPFMGASVSQLLSAHMNSPIPRLPAEHRQFQPLVDGLLAKDPDDRFQTARELLTGLEWFK